MPGAHLEKTAERQEEYEHHDRVEPDCRGMGQRRIHGADVSAADRDRDRQVHARSSCFDAA